MKKRCPKCKKIRLFTHGYCKKCYSEYQMKWLKADINREKRSRECDKKYQKRKRLLRLVNKTEEYNIWRAKHPNSSSAHGKVNYLINIGKIKRGVCCICGNKRSYAHHENYNKPLDIIWLCPSHHKKYHLGLVDIIKIRKEKKI